MFLKSVVLIKYEIYVLFFVLHCFYFEVGKKINLRYWMFINQ